MSALTARRSRAALRIVAGAEQPGRQRMSVTVALPEGFGADVDAITARARQIHSATRGFTTARALKGVVLDLLALERLAREARERLG